MPVRLGLPSGISASTGRRHGWPQEDEEPVEPVSPAHTSRPPVAGGAESWRSLGEGASCEWWPDGLKWVLLTALSLASTSLGTWLKSTAKAPGPELHECKAIHSSEPISFPVSVPQFPRALCWPSKAASCLWSGGLVYRSNPRALCHLTVGPGQVTQPHSDQYPAVVATIVTRHFL